MPSVSESMSGTDPQREDILTLPEAAAYLRVEEAGLAEMAESASVPVRKVAGQWRFSRRALEVWVRFPDLPPGDPLRFHWLEGPPLMEGMLQILERRILLSLARAKPEGGRPEPGTKQAVLRHYGANEDDSDLDEQLAEMRRIREAGG